CLLVAGLWPVLRVAGAHARRTLSVWLRALPGGVEATRTLVLAARAMLLLAAIATAAALGSELFAEIQTPLYVSLGQSLLAGVAVAVAWLVGVLLARKLDGVSLP